MKQVYVPFDVVYGPIPVNIDGRVLTSVPNYRLQEMMYLVESDEGVELPVERIGREDPEAL